MDIKTPPEGSSFVMLNLFMEGLYV